MSLPSLSSAQQYIQQLIRKDYKDIDAILDPPVGQDEASWKYEHLRLFCSELNGLAVRLQDECDPMVSNEREGEEREYVCLEREREREREKAQ